MNAILKRLQQHLIAVITIKKTPHEIALGFAIGTLIGILPTPGISFLLGFLVMLVYTKISKISLFAGIVFWNPLLTIPLYPLSYAIGDIFFKGAPVIPIEFTFFQQIVYHSRRFLIGNIILATAFSIISYILIRLAGFFYQRQKK